MATSDAGGPVTRPALKTLQADQRALLEPDATERRTLREGFCDRRELIEWYQRAVVRTFGQLAEAWPPVDLARDQVLLANCIVDGAQRRRYVDDPPAVAEAREYRRALESEFVHPSARAAYRELRKVAGDYGVDADDTDDLELPFDDPADQEYVGMRPGFSRLDRDQQVTLERLWGGFDDRDELLDWLHDLNESTHGEADDDLSGRVLEDAVAVAHFLGDGVDHRQARAYRERFAIAKILPAFVAAVEAMDSIELASGSSSQYIPGG